MSRCSVSSDGDDNDDDDDDEYGDDDDNDDDVDTVINDVYLIADKESPLLPSSRAAFGDIS